MFSSEWFGEKDGLRKLKMVCKGARIADWCTWHLERSVKANTIIRKLLKTLMKLSNLRASYLFEARQSITTYWWLGSMLWNSLYLTHRLRVTHKMLLFVKIGHHTSSRYSPFLAPKSLSINLFQMTVCGGRKPTLVKASHNAHWHIAHYDRYDVRTCCPKWRLTVGNVKFLSPWFGQ